jgi:hypothetical protein
MSAISESLRVELTQRGGIIGGSWTVSLDAAELPEEEARELERLIREADVFDLPRFGFASPGAAVDAFEYDLRVAWGKRRRHVRLDDTQVPARLRPLLNYLAVRAGAT